jgi:hypothetical protein
MRFLLAPALEHIVCHWARAAYCWPPRRRMSTNNGRRRGSHSQVRLADY